MGILKFDNSKKDLTLYVETSFLQKKNTLFSWQRFQRDIMLFCNLKKLWEAL